MGHQFWGLFPLSTHSACSKSLSSGFLLSPPTLLSITLTLCLSLLSHPLEPAVLTAAKTILQSHKSDLTAPLPKTTRMKPNHSCCFGCFYKGNLTFLASSLYPTVYKASSFFSANGCLFSVQCKVTALSHPPILFLIPLPIPQAQLLQGHGLTSPSRPLL